MPHGGEHRDGVANVPCGRRSIAPQKTAGWQDSRELLRVSDLLPMQPGDRSKCRRRNAHVKEFLKDRSANGTSASIGRAERITRSNGRGWSGWMWPQLVGAEEFPTDFEVSFLVYKQRWAAARRRCRRDGTIPLAAIPGPTDVPLSTTTGPRPLPATQRPPEESRVSRSRPGVLGPTPLPVPFHGPT